MRVPAFTTGIICLLFLFSSISKAEQDFWDVAVVGDGPAGYAAAIEAARSHYRVLHLVGDGSGGQISSTLFLDNWPGEPHSITGTSLITNLQMQTIRLGVRHEPFWVHSVTPADSFFIISTDTQAYKARTVILASGASPRVPAQLTTSNGYPDNPFIHTCTTCDGPRYKGKKIAIIGGGDTAAEQAISMASQGSEVHLLIRGGKMRAQGRYQQQIKDHVNITTYFHTEVNSTLISDYKAKWLGHSQPPLSDNLRLILNISSLAHPPTLDVSGLFIATGHTPLTGYLPGELTTTDAYLKNRKQPIYSDKTFRQQLHQIPRKSHHPFDVVQAAEGAKTVLNLHGRLTTQSESADTHDIIIIGNTAAAFTAAIYAARENYRVTLVDMGSSLPDTVFWPEQGRINTYALKQRMIEQALRAGAHVVSNTTNLFYQQAYSHWLVTVGDSTLISKTLIIDSPEPAYDDLLDVSSPTDGIFVAGDAVENAVNQAVSAAATGTRAATAATLWLKRKTP